MAGGLTASQIKGLARRAEIESGTGATGLTLLRFGEHSRSPVEKLIHSKDIGQDEIRAALELTSVYKAIAGCMMLRGQRWERVDYGRGGGESKSIIDAYQRYKAFVGHWTRTNPQLLAVVIAVVMEERSLRAVDSCFLIRNGTSKKLTIQGLRDYARRSGWVRRSKDKERETRPHCA